MEVVPLRDDHLPALHTIYVRLTGALPHCRFQPSAVHFADSLRHPAIAGTEVFVVEDNGGHRATLGFAALLPPPPPAVDGSHVEAAAGAVPEAEVTALFAEDEAALGALVERVTARAHALGARRLLAFPQAHERCPIRAYNAGWCGLSDRLPAVARVLARSGFAPYYRELQLTCSGDRFPPAPTPLAAEVELRPGADRWGRPVLRAMLGEEQVGVCAYSTLERVSDDPAAARCGFIWWLHTEESHRRQGIARALLTRVLADLAGAGCTECWITTGADNWPAQPLYLSAGFEIVDASTCFSSNRFAERQDPKPLSTCAMIGATG